MKSLLKKWIFIAQFHFQGPDSEYESGSSMAIRIRIQPDPDPKHCDTSIHVKKGTLS